MSANYARRRLLVADLAPPRPACFQDHRQWLEFLSTSAEAQTTNVPGPLDLRKSAPAFNFGFDFCRDCTAKFSQEMQSVGKCKPGHLKALAGAQREKEST